MVVTKKCPLLVESTELLPNIFSCFRVLLAILGMMESWVEPVIEAGAVPQEKRVTVATKVTR